MAVLREAGGPVPRDALEAAWDDPVQRDRCLDALMVDGLVEPVKDGTFALPS
jgi:A/G-specific adenine glycosylase